MISSDGFTADDDNVNNNDDDDDGDDDDSWSYLLYGTRVCLSPCVRLLCVWDDFKRKIQVSK